VRGALDAHRTAMLALPPDVVRKRVRAPLLLLVVLLVLYSFPSLLAPPFGGAGPWRFVEGIPLPPQAQQVQRAYQRGPYYDDSAPTRITTFDTDHPVAAIQQFYGAALPRRGWHHGCTHKYSDVPRGDDWGEVRDVYVPTGWWHDYAIYIAIGAPTADGTRQVDIAEIVLRDPLVPCPPVATEPPDSLFGAWQATDAVAGQDFMLRLDDQGHASVVLPHSARAPELRGTYRLDTTTLHLTLTAHPIYDVHRPEPCVPFPAFLRNVCQAINADEDPNAPDVPLPPDWQASRIDTSFAVVRDGDTLLLTDPSGSTQAFHKVSSK